MLNWITNKEVKEVYNKLFLCYKKGYPLTVCEWREGSGYVSIYTGLTFRDPEKVVYIDLP